jgi:hypothetical protein
VAASEGKKVDEGTTMSPPKSNLAAVADPLENQTLTPAQATTRPTSNIVIKWLLVFEVTVKI